MDHFLPTLAGPPKNGVENGAAPPRAPGPANQRAVAVALLNVLRKLADEGPELARRPAADQPRAHTPGQDTSRLHARERKDLFERRVVEAVGLCDRFVRDATLQDVDPA